ncbi:MAG: hypothetical protein ACR2PS_13685, partial [Pseudomonadales bacterium]
VSSLDQAGRLYSGFTPPFSELLFLRRTQKIAKAKHVWSSRMVYPPPTAIVLAFRSIEPDRWLQTAKPTRKACRYKTMDLC